MSDDLTGYTPNKTLGPAILAACEADGIGWWGQWRISRALRKLTDADWVKLERKCTKLATEAGLPMGTDDIVAGCYVGEWGDGTFFRMIIENLPAILEFIKGLVAIFGLFALVFLAVLLLPSMVSAACVNGVCTPPARTVERERSVVVKVTKVIEAQPVRKFVRERKPVRTLVDRVIFWR